jgi:hypothetical protein
VVSIRGKGCQGADLVATITKSDICPTWLNAMRNYHTCRQCVSMFQRHQSLAGTYNKYISPMRIILHIAYLSSDLKEASYETITENLEMHVQSEFELRQLLLISAHASRDTDGTMYANWCRTLTTSRARSAVHSQRNDLNVLCFLLSSRNANRVQFHPVEHVISCG